jgi:hypothetical protein
MYRKKKLEIGMERERDLLDRTKTKTKTNIKKAFRTSCFSSLFCFWGKRERERERDRKRHRR